MQHLMEVQKLCDFCKEQRSMIYCRSDAAYLCLSCDRSVHSANALSSRHIRTLVCELCNCQIAIVRCLEEKLSLCQNCNSSGHGTPASPTEHKRQTINSYSGCPSAAELSNIWSFFYPDKSNCNPGADSVILEDGSKCLSQCPLAQEATMDPMDSDVEQLHGIESFNSPDQKDFDISEMDWGVENCEALFGESVNDDSQQFFKDGGYDSFFGIGNLCSTECSEECTHEVKGTNLKSKTTQQACSNSVSEDSDTNSKSDPHILSPRPAQSSSSPSFPDPTVDHETGAHQPSKVSSMPTVLEHRSCTDHHPQYRLSSAIRDCAVLRYKEKRKSRKFDRKVRYASRKAGAEVRKRVKGRFVKAGDPYDYDPMHLTKEFTTLSKVFQETHVA